MSKALTTLVRELKLKDAWFVKNKKVEFTYVKKNYKNLNVTSKFSIFKLLYSPLISFVMSIIKIEILSFFHDSSLLLNLLKTNI